MQLRDLKNKEIFESVMADLKWNHYYNLLSKYGDYLTNLTVLKDKYSLKYKKIFSDEMVYDELRGFSEDEIKNEILEYLENSCYNDFIFITYNDQMLVHFKNNINSNETTAYNSILKLTEDDLLEGTNFKMLDASISLF